MSSLLLSGRTSCPCSTSSIFAVSWGGAAVDRRLRHHRHVASDSHRWLLLLLRSWVLRLGELNTRLLALGRNAASGMLRKAAGCLYLTGCWHLLLHVAIALTDHLLGQALHLCRWSLSPRYIHPLSLLLLLLLWSPLATKQMLHLRVVVVLLLIIADREPTHLSKLHLLHARRHMLPDTRLLLLLLLHLLRLLLALLLVLALVLRYLWWVLDRPLVFSGHGPFTLAVPRVQMLVLLEPKLVQFCPTHLMWFFEEFGGPFEYIRLDPLVVFLFLGDVPVG